MTANLEREARRQNRLEIEAVLQANGIALSGRACRCPFHDDSAASAGIYQGKDGAWRFACMAASCGFRGDVFDLEARFGGKELRDVLPRAGTTNRVSAYTSSPAPAPARQTGPPAAAVESSTQPTRVFATIEDLTASLANIVEVNPYTDPDSGLVDLVTIRVEPPGGKKQFMQASLARRHGINRDGFVMKKPPGLQPIFNRRRLRDADTVIVVEGEKSVRALTPLLPPSLAATTAPGGAGKGRAEEADWRPLAGKRVYLWPDADPPDEHGVRGGIDHMRRVGLELERLQPRPDVYWLDCDAMGLPPKGDAADFVAKLAGLPEAQQLDALDVQLRHAERLNPSRDLHRTIEQTISGELYFVPWPWSHFSHLTQALIPGSVGLICGSAGSAKTWWMHAALLFWHKNGHRPAYLPLEKDLTWHLKRLQAILDQNFKVTELTWIKHNAALARESYERCREDLDSIAPWITIEPDHPMTQKDALAWIDRRAADGCRVLAIDPVTALITGRDVWIEDQEFLRTARQLMRKHKASLVLVTHPRKSGKTLNPKSAPLDDLAGGAAYARFTDWICWLLRYSPLTSECMTSAGRATMRHNRTMRLCKTNDGPGEGTDIAYWFGGEAPLFREIGPIIPDGPTEPPSPAEAPPVTNSGEAIPL